MTSVVDSAESVTIPLKGLARTAARRMVKAWEAPVFHLGIDVDMSAALAAKEAAPKGVTISDILMRACAAALRAHPRLNAWYDDESVTQVNDVNIGLAVATDAGLMVPVIHRTDQLSITGIAAARRDIVERARTSQLGMADVTGGTFTVSNLGMLGIDEFDAILNVPQVAILAVSATRQRQVWIESVGGGAWKPIARFTLTCDHRAIDGATGAAFLATLRSELESAQSGS
jgi:pyruvate dehydrogenase E2 component (dihydrolipoamide acetyltransferase)